MCKSFKKGEEKILQHLDLRIFEDNKKIWRCVKPLFSDKQKILDRNIVIAENDTIYSDNKEVAEKLNNFFIEAVENLEIEPFELNNELICSDHIENIVKQYELHPSILKIEEKITLHEKFRFSNLPDENMQQYILQLNSKKASIENDLIMDILKRSNDIVSNYLCNIYNNAKNN